MDSATKTNGGKPSDRQFRALIMQCPTRLRFKQATKKNQLFPGLRLPFTDTRPGRANFWAFPETEGYASGCDVGRFAAIAYLRALREGPSHCHRIGDVVVAAIEANGGALSDSQSGIIVAFFAEVHRWLNVAVQACGTKLMVDYSDVELEYRLSEAASRTREQSLESIKASARAAGVELGA